jgi:TRAP-type C4-dicarboxylate transport system permease small subunit
MKKAVAWLRARAENVAAILFAAMFLSFMIQIVSRYILNDPYSWTIEASLIAWLWIVFWCSGFLLNNRDHVRFDVLYGWVRPGTRRVFALISVVAIVLAFAVSLPANFGFVTFMKIERSGTLGIRLDYIFSIYIVFAVAVLVRYGLYALRIARGGDPDQVMNQGGTAVPPP